MENENSFRFTSQLILGIFFVIAGGLILLGNLDIVDVGPFWKLWPLLIVGIGLNKTIQARKPDERRNGVWLMFIGGWFFVSIYHMFGLSFHTSWPLLIVGWGLGMVWKSAATQARLNVE
ncbi:MAG: DUF5668 domain-containing protein [Bacteroidota bacterium]